jgi:hypothetical protein
MMVLMLALLLAAPQGCIDTRRECRACTTTDGKQRCSNPGIACQPLTRLCRPNTDMAAAERPKTAKPDNR